MSNYKKTDGSTSGVEYKIVYLPDCAAPYSIRAKAGMGSVKFNPTLTDGWNLTGFTSEVDSQIDETLTAVGGLAKAFVALTDNKDEEMKVGLYRLKFDENGFVNGFAGVNVDGGGESCAKVKFKE